MLAFYASTATQAYNQQAGVRGCACVWKLPVCYGRQAVHFVLRTPLSSLPLYDSAASCSDSTRSYKLTYMLAS